MVDNSAAGSVPVSLKQRLLLKDLPLVKQGLLLMGILLLGLGLRLFGLRFGLPFPYHFDETVYTGAALNLGAGKAGVQINPTGFTNILFVEYALYFVIGKLTGLFSSAASFGASYKADPSNFILLARLTSALFGAMTVAVIYAVGQGWKSAQARLLAALFMAVAFLHVRDSHFGVPDITAAFFVLLSVVLCVQSLQAGQVGQNTQRLGWRSRQMLLLWLAFFSGTYAVMTKWSVWPVFVPAALTLIEHWRQAETGTVLNRLKQFVLPTLLAVLFGFMLGGFQILLAPSAYLQYAIHEMGAGKSGGFFIWQIDNLPGWLFYIKVLFQGLGIIFAGLILITLPARLVTALRSRNRMDLILLSFPVIYFLLMGATRHYFARYILPVLPFAILFLVDGLLWAKARLQVRYPRAGQAAFAALLVVILAQPVINSLRLGYLFNAVDTRTLAHQWIEANIPDGALIAVDSPYVSVPLSTEQEPIANSKKTYQVKDFLGQSGLSARDLDWYRQQKVDYLVASSFIYNIPLNDPVENQARQAFYRSLDENLTLVQVFRPVTADQSVEPGFVFDEIYAPLISLWQRDQPGPVLKIYRID